MTTTISRRRLRRLQVWRLRQSSRVLRPPTGRRQRPVRADIPGVMGPANRSPGTPIMGAPDSAGGFGVMGGADPGPRVDVMGGPDAGPRVDVMGSSVLRFADSLFTGRTTR